MATCNFAINDQFYLNFSEVNNFYLYFKKMLESLFEISYSTRKTSVKKNFFFQKSRYFLQGGFMDIIFGLL